MRACKEFFNLFVDFVVHWVIWKDRNEYSITKATIKNLRKDVIIFFRIFVGMFYFWVVVLETRFFISLKIRSWYLCLKENELV